MSKNTLAVSAAIGFVLLCAGIAWLGGYDFDHRSPDVAYGAFTALTLAVMVFVSIKD